MNGHVNTHRSIEDAKKWIEAGCPKKKPFEVLIIWVVQPSKLHES
jgi:hypothetical protein